MQPDWRLVNLLHAIHGRTCKSLAHVGASTRESNSPGSRAASHVRPRSQSQRLCASFPKTLQSSTLRLSTSLRLAAGSSAETGLQAVDEVADDG